MSCPVTSDNQGAALLPHQANFIEKFFSKASARAHLLQSVPGLGTTYTVARLVQRALSMSPDAQILILTPSALQVELQGVLTEIGAPAEAVDRYRFRELQDSALGNHNIWRAGVAFILSLDFAKQEDVARSLAPVPWNLLIVEEAHLLKGLREDLVRNIIASNPDLRVLLISSTGLDHLPALGIEPLTPTRWRLSDVMDSAGKSFFSLTLPQLELIEFHEEPIERVMRGLVEEITDQFNASSDAEMQSTLFRRSLASSPAALEARMRRLRNRLEHGGSRDPSQGTLFPAEGDDVETDTSDLPYVVPERREALRASLSRGLKELEVAQC